MAFWKKKKPVEEPKSIPLECHHKYRDFPWYIESVYNQTYKEYKVEIIEPYVCVFCGKRNNVTLCSIERYGTRKEAAEVIEAMQQTYGDNIRPRAFIENDIHDMQLVDRDYLRALAIVKPGALVGMDENAQVALRKG